MPPSKHPVSIRPGDTVDDSGLLDLSMEEVVSLFLDKERSRHKLAKEDENQAEI